MFWICHSCSFKELDVSKCELGTVGDDSCIEKQWWTYGLEQTCLSMLCQLICSLLLTRSRSRPHDSITFYNSGIYQRDKLMWRPLLCNNPVLPIRCKHLWAMGVWQPCSRSAVMQYQSTNGTNIHTAGSAHKLWLRSEWPTHHGNNR